MLYQTPELHDWALWLCISIHLSRKYCAIVGKQLNRQSSFEEYILQFLDNGGSPGVATASKWQIDWDCYLLVLGNACL